MDIQLREIKGARTVAVHKSKSHRSARVCAALTGRLLV